MDRSTWKKFEARVAAVFGSTRTPLSGGNSKVTRSDSFHPKLFLECKHGIKSAFWTLYNQVRPRAKKENKIPVLCLGNKNQEGFLICCHVSDFPQVFLAWIESQPHLDVPLAYAVMKEMRDKLEASA